MRLDQALVKAGIVKTRSQAREQIKRKNVMYKDKLVSKPSMDIDDLNTLELIDKKTYVGRGAYKLMAALDYFNVNLEGLIVADVGASTGGFTQVLLERGVQKVYAIDVGHDQLDDFIKSDSRVMNMEKTNIRDFPDKKSLEQKVDFVVCDLSFVSIRNCLDSICSLFQDNKAQLIALIKPQFEVGQKFLNKQGVVKGVEIVEKILKEIEKEIKQRGFNFVQIIKSPITGKLGNEEYLFYCKR